jgi:hypothetical protein
MGPLAFDSSINQRFRRKAMFKTSLALRSLVVFSSLVVIAPNSVFAVPAAGILGTYRDTSNASQWMVKDLGPSSDWEGERTYTNGVLVTSGYVQAKTVYPNDAWVTGIPWISLEESADGPVNYFSYVTIINDTGIAGVDSAASFSGLSIYFSADDLVDAFVINGVIYDGFTAQLPGAFVSYKEIFIPSGGNIPWNVSGDNTVEIIVYNLELGYVNPTGLSATMQAHYAPVPEPETWAMLLAGLGIVGAVTRRRRIKAAM